VLVLVLVLGYVSCVPVHVTNLYAHHPVLYHHTTPLCQTTVEARTIETCHLEPEKVCETKPQTYVQITGYEKQDCKEVEVCKPVFRQRRSADPLTYVLPACEKATQEICNHVPKTEEVTKDLEFCRINHKKVCRNIEVNIPKVDCEGDDATAAEKTAPANEAEQTDEIADEETEEEEETPVEKTAPESDAEETDETAEEETETEEETPVEKTAPESGAEEVDETAEEETETEEETPAEKTVQGEENSEEEDQPAEEDTQVEEEAIVQKTVETEENPEDEDKPAEGEEVEEESLVQKQAPEETAAEEETQAEEENKPAEEAAPTE